MDEVLGKRALQLRARCIFTHSSHQSEARPSIIDEGCGIKDTLRKHNAKYHKKRLPKVAKMEEITK